MIGIEYKPYIIDMGYLFPPSLAQFLGSGDEVHIFKEVTEHLDVGHLDSDFNGMGQRPYHPLMLLRLLMWGMANGVVSTRKIEVFAHRDISYIYLAGGQRPDYRSLARFRRRNAKEIEKLFKQSVLLCAGLGMVNLGHIALDGTKLKANSSKHKAMSYGRMKQEEERLGKEIAELMRQAEAVDKEEDKTFGEENNGYTLPEELQRREERLEKIRQLRAELEREKREEQGLKEGETPLIKDKEQRSFADKKARIMLMKRGEFDYAYNAQAGTEESHGIIVVADLTNQASDSVHLPEMVAQVRELRKELGFGTAEDKKTEMIPDSLTNEASDSVHIPQMVAEVRELGKEPAFGADEDKKTEMGNESLTTETSNSVHLPEMVAQVRELGKGPGLGTDEDNKTEMSADSGYFSAANIRTEGEGIELLIASGRENKETPKESGENRVYSVERFCYNKNQDVWQCPDGRLLIRPTESSNNEPSSSYHYICGDCSGCRLRQYCLKPNGDKRALVVNEDQLLHGEMRARLKNPEKQAIYRKRKWVAEQPFGQIKEGMGFRGVTMRGETYARAQWLLVCAVQNVMKAVRFIADSRPWMHWLDSLREECPC
ncbi:MAG: transposase [Chloroflexi bacterium]|nr:transposase [Chloroflexota bacterium]